MKPIRPLNYMERINKALAEFLKPKKPGEMGLFLNPDIRHDDWCKMMKGKPECNCSPDIYIELDDGRFEITRAGTLKKVGI
jgi:hypothetical protein